MLSIIYGLYKRVWNIMDGFGRLTGNTMGEHAESRSIIWKLKILSFADSEECRSSSFHTVHSNWLIGYKDRTV